MNLRAIHIPGRPARPTSAAPAAFVQRCACGKTSGPAGTCADCRRRRTPGLQPKLRVNTPGDRYEREADRLADAVLRGGPVPGTLAGPARVQRQEPPAPAPKTEAEKYQKAAKKTAEALLETETGKKIKKNAEQLATSLPGLVIVGGAAAAIVTKAAVKNEALPLQPPAVPLDRVGLPGIKMHLTWEGPLRSPTKAVIGFSGTFGAGKNQEKRQPSRAERQRAENVRLAGEQQRFRESLTTPADRAAEEAAMINHLVRQAQNPASPLYIPGLRPADEAPPVVPQAGTREEEGPVQRTATGPSPGVAPPIVQDVLQTPGRPLDPGTRAFMEHRFGHDFSRVRVHTDARAAASSEAVQARAFTVGRDVVFGAGEYRPETETGRRLLAHELVHVVQQEGAPQGLQRQSPAPGTPPNAAPAAGTLNLDVTTQMVWALQALLIRPVREAETWACLAGVPEYDRPRILTNYFIGYRGNSAMAQILAQRPPDIELDVYLHSVFTHLWSFIRDPFLAAAAHRMRSNATFRTMVERAAAGEGCARVPFSVRGDAAAV